MNQTFTTYHPIINFGFFCAVIGLGIFMIHPVFLTISVAASITYGIITGGKKTLKFILIVLLPMILIVTVVNPLVNPRGNTVLFYTEYSQVTLEATIYGLLTGFMLASIMLWFSCYNKVVTTDKFVYLFGKIIPSSSLIFSMVMRFIPNYKMQIAKISDAQKGIGQDVTSGSILQRCKHGVRIISMMFTWALENSIESADSMRARGYGLKDRSAFSIYRFDRRDMAIIMVLITTTLVVVIGAFLGKCSVTFYPDIILPKFDAINFAVYVAYGVLCFLPSILEIKEVIMWRRIQSET